MKFSIDAMLDAALDNLSGVANGLIVCTAGADGGSGVPASYADITTPLGTGSGVALTGIVTINSGDFTKADGDVSGRKSTVAEQATIPIVATGDAAHICILNTSTSEVLYVTECTVQSLSSGSNVTVPVWDIEVRDPSA